MRLMQEEEKGEKKDLWKQIFPDLYKDIRSDELKQKNY